MSKKKLYSGSGIVYSTDPGYKPEEEMTAPEQIAPAEQKIKITLDKKHRAGKVVTLIEGLVLSEKELGEMAKQLKSFCGTGGSFGNDFIIIQGDHREKILQWFLKKGFLKSVLKK